MNTHTMQSHGSDGTSIKLSFASAHEVHHGLESAVKTLIASAAQDRRCGIKVTRHEPGAYTVALDDTVPFGETHEDVAA
ncbi:hypothetical protein [Arthrobacter sp. B3I4]|uniref:hypothetical protein n=1 Tax=Arthrobacter sp. B3I4 TaxID=3042267 RepID=UPI002781640D|nr:hypothetical protein [Arthrobacter sp. B3I4]MDQ0754457.1 hypothetical protein [Arthrobacter sp. B3I4]